MKDTFYIEFVDFLGEIRNDTDINGKAFIFKILDLVKEYDFEVILCVHPIVPPFLTIHDDKYKIINNDLKEEILKQFSLTDLLSYKKDEN